MTTNRRPAAEEPAVPDAMELYRGRCARGDTMPREGRGFTDREADVNDLAARLLVAAYGSSGEDDRDLGQWVTDVVPLTFTVAEAFMAERDRRRT